MQERPPPARIWELVCTCAVAAAKCGFQSPHGVRPQGVLCNGCALAILRLYILPSTEDACGSAASARGEGRWQAGRDHPSPAATFSTLCSNAIALGSTFVHSCFACMRARSTRISSAIRRSSCPVVSCEVLTSLTMMSVARSVRAESARRARPDPEKSGGYRTTRGNRDPCAAVARTWGGCPRTTPG